MDDVRTFLEIVYGRKPADLHLLVWEKLAEKLSYWFQDVDRAVDFVAAHPVNVYTGVNLSGRDYGPRNRCKAADIAAQCAFIADIDVAGPAHKTKTLPATYDDARLILPPELKPTLLIDSGNGLQGWWVLRDPVVFSGDQERQHSQALAIGWHRAMERLAGARGWKLDAVYDLSRVLRIPGSINRKEDVPDKQARILEVSDARYTIADFEEYLHYLKAAEPDSKAKRIARAFMPPAVGNLAHTREPSIDPALYAALWANSLIFRETWHKTRMDLKSNSQSEWDLALANILWDAEISDQHAADAILHYRRIHNAPPKDNPDDYLRRTLAKARDRSRPPQRDEDLLESIASATTPLATIEEIEFVPKPVQAAAEEPEATAEEQYQTGSGLIADETIATRLEALNVSLQHQINGKPVPVTKITWVRGKKDDASWRIELTDGQIVTLSDSSQYADHASLKRAFRNQVNGVLAAEGKKGYWARSGVILFQSCIQEEKAGDLNDVRGDITDLLERYLTAQMPIPAPAVWIDTRNLHLPLVYKGQIGIHAEGMTAYMNRMQGERLTVREVRSGLSALKAEREKINGPRGRSQSRYMLPADKWSPEEYIEIATQARAMRQGQTPEDQP